MSTSIVDFSIPQGTIANDPTTGDDIIPIPMRAGVLSAQLTGGRVFIENIRVRGSIAFTNKPFVSGLLFPSHSNIGNWVRMTVVLDRQPPSFDVAPLSTPLFNDIFRLQTDNNAYVDSMLAGLNPANTSRFLVLRDIVMDGPMTNTSFQTPPYVDGVGPAGIRYTTTDYVHFDEYIECGFEQIIPWPDAPQQVLPSTNRILIVFRALNNIGSDILFGGLSFASIDAYSHVRVRYHDI